MAHGSYTKWISGLSFPALETPEARTHVRQLLSRSSTSPESDRARAFSRMILFDYVIANWDRWSGGNIGEANGGIVFLDHDAAFFDPAPPALAGARKAFADADRFSRGFVSALRTSRSDLESRIGDDDASEPLLTSAQRKGLEDRVDEALRAIDEKRKRLGDEAVLFFR